MMSLTSMPVGGSFSGEVTRRTLPMPPAALPACQTAGDAVHDTGRSALENTEHTSCVSVAYSKLGPSTTASTGHASWQKPAQCDIRVSTACNALYLDLNYPHESKRLTQTTTCRVCHQKCVSQKQESNHQSRGKHQQQLTAVDALRHVDVISAPQQGHTAELHAGNTKQSHSCNGL